jgi:hypothetical protein
MGKGESAAYVALPMNLADDGAAERAQRRQEDGACVTFGKLCVVAAALSLVVVGGMHMIGCNGKHSYQKKTQLRNHHFGAWKPRTGMDVPGPHHVPQGTLFGPDHHRQHDEELPAVLRHPMHKPGKNQAVMHVHDDGHPDPSGFQELEAIKKNQQIIKHVIDSTHHNTLPQELRHPPHHGGQPNTVQVKRARHEPEDFPHHENHPNNEVEVEMPDILLNPPKRTNGNGKQSTYVVHRHHDAPTPREVPVQEWSSSDDVMLDTELEQLERDFNEDFRHESQRDEEEEEDKEEYDAKLDAELEQLEHDFEEDFNEIEWDEDFGEEDDEDSWETEDEDEEEEDWEMEIEEWDENDLDAEILEAFEDAEEEDVELIVVEERLEAP